jgi:hypothetical protein
MTRTYFSGSASHELIIYLPFVLAVMAFVFSGLLGFHTVVAVGLAALIVLILALKTERGVIWALMDDELVRLSTGFQGAADIEETAPSAPRAVALEWSLDPLTVCAALEFETGAAWRMPWRFAIGARRQADAARAFADALGVPFHDRVNRRR